MIFDLTIIGGGPAAAAAAVYAARKQLHTLVIAKEFGGQSVVSPMIHNWIGTPAISGNDLARSLERHVREYEGERLVIKNGFVVTSIEASDTTFIIRTDEDTFETRTVLMATGATRRKLTVPGAAEYDQKGLTYCATCDGPLFSDMDVAVIGGGNAGFESASQLLAYTKSVTLLDYSAFKADQITIDSVCKHTNMRALENAELLEVIGERMVTGIRYRDKVKNEEHTLPVSGVFVEIGMVPNTQIVAELVSRNTYGYIMTDPKTQRTSRTGIWAAGDCTDGLYAQNNIAAGDAIKALENIYSYLRA